MELRNVKRTHLEEVPVGDVIPHQYFLIAFSNEPRAFLPADYKNHGGKVRAEHHQTILKLKEE